MALQPAEPQQPATPVVLSAQVIQAVQAHISDSWQTYGTGISAGMSQLFKANSVLAAKSYREIGTHLVNMTSDIGSWVASLRFPCSPLNVHLVSSTGLGALDQ